MLQTRTLSTGSRLYFDFKHEHHEPPTQHTRVNGKPSIVKVTTHCLIYPAPMAQPGQMDPVAHGHSFCFVGDNFHKADGRERALRRAVKELSREESGAVLAAYFARTEREYQVHKVDPS